MAKLLAKKQFEEVLLGIKDPIVTARARAIEVASAEELDRPRKEKLTDPDLRVRTIVGHAFNAATLALGVSDFGSDDKPDPSKFKTSELQQQSVRLLIDLDLRGVLFKGLKENPDFWKIVLKRLSKDATSPVRRELLLAMSKLPVEQVTECFYVLAQKYDGQDIFYRAALNIACGTDPDRRDAILADFDKHFPEWNDKVADLVWELRPKSVMPRLVKQVADPKLTAAQRGRIVDILAGSDDISAGRSMLALLGKDTPAEVRDRALENLKLFLPGKWKALANSKELSTAISTLLDAPGTQSIGLRLAAVSGGSQHFEKVSNIALAGNDIGVRQEAVRALGKMFTPEAVEVLKKIATTGPLMRVEAINALGLHLSADPRTTGASAKLGMQFLQSTITQSANPEIQPAALAVLAGSQAGAQWLLRLHEKKELPEKLVADVGRLLRNTPFQGLRNKAMILFPAPGRLDPKKLPPIAELAKRIGSAERGKQLLAASLKGEAQCLALSHRARHGRQHWPRFVDDRQERQQGKHL